MSRDSYVRSFFLLSTQLQLAGILSEGAVSAGKRDERPNPAVDPAPSGRWTLRDKAAQRRSPLR
jgi:hypothetical protein